MKINTLFWLFGAFSFQQVVGDPEPEDKFTQCLDGWYQYGSKCYRTFGSKTSSGWLNWQSARETCHEYGGALASIHSNEEHEFLVMFGMFPVEYSIWLGLNDNAVDKKYEWDDKSNVNFTMWDHNEPSYEHNGNPENCVQMVLSEKSDKLVKWNDQSCDRRLPYLCQMSADPKLSTNNPKYCSESRGGGYSHHESCYHVVNSPKTWTDAEDYCKSTYKGHVVAMTDDMVQRFLIYMLKDSGVRTTVWTGYKASKSNSVGLWSSGWYLSYTKWATSDQRMRDGTCSSFLRSGLWEMQSCERELPFVCEVSTVKAPKLQPSTEGFHCPETPSDWIDLGGDYCYFFKTGVHVNWNEANFQCLRRGGTLASIHSREELESLEQFVRYKAWSVHIGLLQKYDNNFAWVDKSEVNFKNWGDGEPNGSDELCVEAVVQGKVMNWNDIGCDNGRSYICSVKKRPPNITVEEDRVICSGELFIIQ